MVKLIKFPLVMKNGVQVRSLEELRENFDIESLYRYYINGKLMIWLENRHYEAEANAIKKINGNKEVTLRKVCEILSVPYSEDADKKIEAATQEYDRIQMIKKITDDERALENRESIALNQEEFERLLEAKRSPIYLVKNLFEIKEEQFYPVEIVGIEKAELLIYADREILDLDKEKISLSQIRVNSEKKIYLNCKSLSEDFIGDNIVKRRKFRQKKDLGMIAPKNMSFYSERTSQYKIITNNYFINWSSNIGTIFSIYDYQKNELIFDVCRLGELWGEYGGRGIFNGIEDILLEKNKLYFVISASVDRELYLACLDLTALNMEFCIKLEKPYMETELVKIKKVQNELYVYYFMDWLRGGRMATVSLDGGRKRLGVEDIKIQKFSPYPFKHIISFDEQYFYILTDELRGDQSNNFKFQKKKYYTWKKGINFSSEYYYGFHHSSFCTEKYFIYYEHNLGGVNFFPILGGERVKNIEKLKDILSESVPIKKELFECEVYKYCDNIQSSMQDFFLGNYMYLMFCDYQSIIVVALDIETLEMEDYWIWEDQDITHDCHIHMYINKDEERLYILNEDKRCLYCLE